VHRENYFKRLASGDKMLLQKFFSASLTGILSINCPCYIPSGDFLSLGLKKRTKLISLISNFTSKRVTMGLFPGHTTETRRFFAGQMMEYDRLEEKSPTKERAFT